MTAAGTAILFRVLRRRASLDSDKNEFISVEFADEQVLSVYEITRADAVRAFAEHCASAGLDPPRGGFGFDVTDFGPAQAVAAPGSFKFIDDAHRDLTLKDRAALEAMADAIQKDLGRRIEITKAEVRAYVRAMKAAQDPEWMKFFANNPKWASF